MNHAPLGSAQDGVLKPGSRVNTTNLFAAAAWSNKQSSTPQWTGVATPAGPPSGGSRYCQPIARSTPLIDASLNRVGANGYIPWLGE